MSILLLLVYITVSAKNAIYVMGTKIYTYRQYFDKIQADLYIDGYFRDEETLRAIYSLLRWQCKL